jgi:hypothetical protein
MEYESEHVATVTLENVPANQRPEDIAFQQLSEAKRAQCSYYRLYDDERGKMEHYSSGNDMPGLRRFYLK